jgi:hypothetical protein
MLEWNSVSQVQPQITLNVSKYIIYVIGTNIIVNLEELPEKHKFKPIPNGKDN